MRLVVMLVRIAQKHLHADNLERNWVVHTPPYFLCNNI